MTEAHESEIEFIDLGSATAETRGNGGAIVPDAPQMRQLFGSLTD